ncbi:DUF4186 domain-containing protein [Microvirga puerhi]|uniref:DUF4186 domain-containing protein n=1 Tax=Microvirga puerhi TaxID=2876078 RepID=A0ABS7VJ97_9HYPH|nr:DUF4186 domain-containing protein [Microvirga puerhi]
MRNIDEVFEKLKKSSFRQGFHLRPEERTYVTEKGLDLVKAHARDFIDKRLAPAYPARDGKQTPFRGHPVFVAQHATGTCCRSCLEKWHGIRHGHALDDSQKAYIAGVVERWIRAEMAS